MTPISLCLAPLLAMSANSEGTSGLPLAMLRRGPGCSTSGLQPVGTSARELASAVLLESFLREIALHTLFVSGVVHW